MEQPESVQEEPAKSESVQEPAKSESVQEPAKSESVQEPAKRESVQEPAKSESVQESPSSWQKAAASYAKKGPRRSILYANLAESLKTRQVSR